MRTPIPVTTPCPVPVHNQIGDGLPEQRKPGRAFEPSANVPTVRRAVDPGAVGRIRMMQETGAERIAGSRGGGRVREAQPDRQG